MSTVDLQIDDILKLKLNALMQQFESHRIFNSTVIIEEKAIVEEVIEEKKESFFHKFFFSEY